MIPAAIVVYLAIGFIWGVRTIDRRYVSFGGYILRLSIFTVGSPIVAVIWFLADRG